MDEKKNDKSSPEKNSPPVWINFLILFLFLTFVINMFNTSSLANKKVQIKYSQFLELLDTNTVKEVNVEDLQILLELKENVAFSEVEEILITEEDDEQYKKDLEKNFKENKIFYTGRLSDPNLVERLIKAGVEIDRPIIVSNPILEFFSSWIFPIIIMYVIYFFFMRSLMKRMGSSDGGFGNFMNVGKSKAKIYNIEKNTGIRFLDVAGQDEAKESLEEIVDFLHNPDKYHKIGAKQPKGALLVGPPGTGKTLLAKAVAGEAAVPFFSLSGSEFIEMYVGVGASRVRDLFQMASKQAPCIIFIDEIDAIGKSRDNQMGSNDEREQTLNQLLAEMDGFDPSKGIVILAATNRPEILDKALLRPGRFDRRIIVEKPDLPGRESILKLHIAKVKTDSKINLKEVALSTSGATGADLANMVNEAALRAVRMGRNAVLQEDLMESVEVVIAGKEKKDRILNKHEKRLVAFHEVGHALATSLQKDGEPVQKITIVPRTMGALGYTMNVPEEEKYLMSKSEILTQIVTLLAGRAAEEVVFGECTTGASNDIERATKLARAMVTQFGMSEEFDMMGLESVENKYLDGRSVLVCSEATGADIDKVVKNIIVESHKKAIELLNSKKEKLNEIAEFLIEKETITGEQFLKILNNEPKDEGEIQN